MIDPWASSTLKAAASSNACIAGTIKFGKKPRLLEGCYFFYSVAHRTKPEGGLYRHQVDLRREAVHI
jgi:hypothetical protein